MKNIDFSQLNALENKIHETLMRLSKETPQITINDAAEVCQCSISKISKFTKKLGFDNYKQYMDFVYGKAINQKVSTTELDRLKRFIDDFDVSLVDKFVNIMKPYQKIILFGYGPSFICTEYFEYKLRIHTNKFVIAVPDEITIENLIDDQSLLVIFSTTGRFKSFNSIHDKAKKKECEILFIIEEYNASLIAEYNNIFWLSKHPQDQSLKPYEKSRVAFFIFIEEVIQNIIYNKQY